MVGSPIDQSRGTSDDGCAGAYQGPEPPFLIKPIGLCSVGGELGAGLLAAGPLIAAGHGYFVAAAAVAVGATTLAASFRQRKRFPDRFPAAFFMKIEG